MIEPILMKSAHPQAGVVSGLMLLKTVPQRFAGITWFNRACCLECSVRNAYSVGARFDFTWGSATRSSRNPRLWCEAPMAHLLSSVPVSRLEIAASIGTT